ncbi:MAG: hypothetical protein Nkreftii_002676 [Candidatus Nitrospira kreftii]|uniref:DUF4142 domain-containing protein n=1 Tax=Candidatus Nitrospira kreftii TaxID=2652173 RepID=A0A7S8FFF6_9BACT|nr:MAG: hypothetical protein Nkreftii_002676 [Candidatus Nitrospira kreftii]
MTLTRYALILVLGLFSIGSAFGQENSPMNLDQDSAMTALDRYNQTSHQIFATLTERAKLFEAKAQLATQCAKGLRLIENVATLTAPNDDDEAQWRHETFFLVRMWFTKEQQDEWYFAGNEVGDYLKSHIDEAHSKEEALEIYKRAFALIMNAQVAVLEKMSHDLDARMNRIKEPRSSD